MIAMKVFKTFSLILFLSTQLLSQESFVIGDSTFFNIRQRTDSLDYYAQAHDFYFDVDCNGSNDLWFHIVIDPIPNNPSYFITQISNISKDTIEFASISPRTYQPLQGFHWGDTVNTDSVKYWYAAEYWNVIKFSSAAGGNWPGDDPYSKTAKRLVIVYRQKVGEDYKYGWFDFNGNRDTRKFKLNFHGAEHPLCQPSIIPISNLETNEIKIFPNPTSNLININIYEWKNEFSQWSLHTIQGQIIYAGPIQHNEITISTKKYNLPNGLYILKIHHSSLIQPISKKVILVH
jgi:hypothetical protein